MPDEAGGGKGGRLGWLGKGASVLAGPARAGAHSVRPQRLAAASRGAGEEPPCGVLPDQPVRCDPGGLCSRRSTTTRSTSPTTTWPRPDGRPSQRPPRCGLVGSEDRPPGVRAVTGERPPIVQRECPPITPAAASKSGPGPRARDHPLGPTSPQRNATSSRLREVLGRQYATAVILALGPVIQGIRTVRLAEREKPRSKPKDEDDDEDESSTRTG